MKREETDQFCPLPLLHLFGGTTSNCNLESWVWGIARYEGQTSLDSFGILKDKSKTFDALCAPVGAPECISSKRFEKVGAVGRVT